MVAFSATKNKEPCKEVMTMMCNDNDLSISEHLLKQADMITKLDLTQVENSSSIQAYHQFCKDAAKEFGSEPVMHEIVGAGQLGYYSSNNKVLTNVVALKGKGTARGWWFNCDGYLDFKKRILRFDADYHGDFDRGVGDPPRTKSMSIEMKDADFLSQKLLEKEEEEMSLFWSVFGGACLGLAPLLLAAEMMLERFYHTTIPGYLWRAVQVRAPGFLGRIPSFLGRAATVEVIAKGSTAVATAGVGATAVAVATGLTIGVGLGYLIENTPRWLGAKKSVSDGIAWGLEKAFGPADLNGKFFKVCEFLGLA